MAGHSDLTTFLEVSGAAERRQCACSATRRRWLRWRGEGGQRLGLRSRGEPDLQEGGCREGTYGHLQAPVCPCERMARFRPVRGQVKAGRAPRAGPGTRPQQDGGGPSGQVLAAAPGHDTPSGHRLTHEEDRQPEALRGKLRRKRSPPHPISPCPPAQAPDRPGTVKRGEAPAAGERPESCVGFRGPGVCHLISCSGLLVTCSLGRVLGLNSSLGLVF